MSMFQKLLTEDQNHNNIQNKKQVEELKSSQEPSVGFFFCFDAKKYFQVEEQQIVQRVKSVFMINITFKDVIKDKPDLYGPFWIATTLIVIIIAASSIMTLFSEKQKQYNFDKISVAASLIYGITFGCPYVIAILVKIFGGVISVVHLICIYGYSLVLFIPITAVCFINSYLIQIVLLIIGYGLSSFFLIKGVLSMDDKMQQKQQNIISIFILCQQFILVLMYKFYFFEIVN